MCVCVCVYLWLVFNVKHIANARKMEKSKAKLIYRHAQAHYFYYICEENWLNHETNSVWRLWFVRKYCIIIYSNEVFTGKCTLSMNLLSVLNGFVKLTDVKIIEITSAADTLISSFRIVCVGKVLYISKVNLAIGQWKIEVLTLRNY